MFQDLIEMQVLALMLEIKWPVGTTMMMTLKRIQKPRYDTLLKNVEATTQL